MVQRSGFLKSVLVSAGLAAWAIGAQASTVEVSRQVSNTHGPYGRETMTINDDVHGAVRASVGAFALQAASLGQFTAFCLDINNVLRLASDYEVTQDSSGYIPFPNTDPLTLAQKSGVQKLYNTVFSTLDLTNFADSAGFQLALWEVVFEGSGVLDVNAGDFSALTGDADDAAVKARANTFLSGINGPATQGYRLTFLESAQGGFDPQYSQNLVTASPIPLPATGLLLVGALGGLASLRRRRPA